ncbi:MAG TPA: hypothetical protein VLM40_23810 [Gemmata sp.]|nr:hypothetical protein [Gemmata sp.]
MSLQTSWAMRGLAGVTWEGLGFAAVLPSIAVVAAFAAAFLGIAIICLNRAENRIRRGYA